MNGSSGRFTPEGFARLYHSLLNLGEWRSDWLKEQLYGGYLACLGPEESGDSRERFFSVLTRPFPPYRTEIQLCRALDALQWNMDTESGRPYSDQVRQLLELGGSVNRAFRERTGYPPNASITTYRLCEASLNPSWEPSCDFNLNAVRRIEAQSPELVYICAPLQGDVEGNIEFARQKAQEVFQEGKIPLCPHLMFPPIADPADPVQDEAARKMCLQLLEQCQQVYVYGAARTAGMRAEIQHARRMGIPIWEEQPVYTRKPEHEPKRPERGR